MKYVNFFIMSIVYATDILIVMWVLHSLDHHEEFTYWRFALVISWLAGQFFAMFKFKEEFQ